MWTTPRHRSSAHKDWHYFIPSGLCIYCGWYCDDCPLGVATCKCSPVSRADKRLKEENSGETSDWE